MVEALKTVFILLSRKNIQKYLAGKFDLSEYELDKIKKYLEETEFNQIETDEKIRIRQLNLKKIPVLKELTLNEVDFLLRSEIDFDGILDIVYAKGGIAKGLGSIEWDRENKCYSEKHDYKYSMLLFQILFHLVTTATVVFIMKELSIDMVWALFLLILWMFFVVFPMFLLWENADIKRKLLKEKFPFVFESNKP